MLYVFTLNGLIKEFPKLLASYKYYTVYCIIISKVIFKISTSINNIF